MRKTVVVVALALIPVSFAHAEMPTVEREALIALYDSTDGDHWSDNSNWKGAVGTECDWHGVYCNPSLGLVHTISLIDNQLSGVIPPELGNLSLLVTLQLSDNQLTGSIPSELENPPLLSQLWLSENQLTGSIPPELGNISLLEKLILSNNQLTGSIPPQLGNLSNLEYLVLGFNNLSGTIPPELGDLTSLVTGLQLNDNHLTGSIPPELGNLVSLKRLLLHANQLSGSIPPEFGNLLALEQLWLYDNQLSGNIPPELADPPVLEQMYLYSNQIGGNIPPELGDTTALRDLALNDNQLSGTIPPELGDMTALRGLNLASNQLSGDIPAELGSLSAFLVLELSFNALHSDSPTLIAFLNSIQIGGDWQSTQTVAPTGLAVLTAGFFTVGDHTIWLSWIPIDYQFNPGDYEVFSSPTGSGVWTSVGWTESKMMPNFPVTGLDPGETYDLAVISHTDPHAFNQNLVTSDFSALVMATTASTGCAQPVIEIAGAGPFTLSLTESYDSYLWSTGGIASSIIVDPSFERLFWVTVTSAGPCKETAAIPVAPITSEIFADGFESGDTSEWSAAVP